MQKRPQLTSFVGMLLLLITISNVSAQRAVTPFSRKITDSTGTKVYIQPQKKKQTAVSITFGYGYSPVTSHNEYSDRIFPYNYSTAMCVVEKNIGAINFGINTEITPWLEINVSFVYSENDGSQPVLDLNGQFKRNDPFSDSWMSLLPTLRINWVRNNWLSVYSRAGVGLGLANRSTRFYGQELVVTTKSTLVYQLSPLGIEIGTGRFNLFVEGGYGYTGRLTAGIKLKIGKSNEWNWYDNLY